MTTWLIVIGYAVGWLWTTRRTALGMIESEAQRVAKHRAYMRRDRYQYQEDEPLVEIDEKMLCLFLGFMIGSVWPIAMTVVIVAGSLRAPTEIAFEKESELKALRKLAEEHNLPMPPTTK